MPSSRSNRSPMRAAAAALAGAWLVATFAAAPAAAQLGGPRPQPIVSPDEGGKPPVTDDVHFDQKLGAQVPMDAELVDESGRTVTLSQLGEGHPILLVPAYYGCPMLCSLVLSGVTSSLRLVDLDAGSDFEVAVVSFDPGETPEMAAEAKAPLMKRYGRPGADQGFHFLTGSEASVRAIMDSIGFQYVYMPERDEYAHAAGIVTLTPDGKVSRYHYGVEFPPRDLRLSLVDAGGGSVGSAVDQVLLYCLHYDPTTGKYSLAILNLVRVAGALTLIAILVFLFVGWRRSKSHPALGEG